MQFKEIYEKRRYILREVVKYAYYEKRKTSGNTPVTKDDSDTVVMENQNSNHLTDSSEQRSKQRTKQIKLKSAVTIVDGKKRKKGDVPIQDSPLKNTK